MTAVYATVPGTLLAAPPADVVEPLDALEEFLSGYQQTTPGRWTRPAPAPEPYDGPVLLGRRGEPVTEGRVP